MTGPAASSAQRILDAAEAIFAHEGYFAATIRGITGAAGVPLQLARYHFGSKDELFQHVLARRADETCRQLELSLERAMNSTASSRLEAIVEAMVSLPIDRLAAGDPGWRHYLQLLAHLDQLMDRPHLLQPFRDRYSKTHALYRESLRTALPQASDAAVDYGLHFLEILVGNAVLDFALARYIGGEPTTQPDWSQLRRHMVAHLVGGLNAQLSLTDAPRASSKRALRKPKG
jgi:AcrR family transcriptional regulator